MYFEILDCDNEICGEYILYKSTMLMYSEVKSQFQLLLGDWYHLSLDVEKETGRCNSFYGLLGGFNFEKTSLRIEPEKKVQLFFKSNLLQEQSGCHYTPFDEHCYYDDEHKLLAFGKINAPGNVFEISQNTFVKMQNGMLLAVYVKLTEDVFDRICFRLKLRKNNKHYKS